MAPHLNTPHGGNDPRPTGAQAQTAPLTEHHPADTNPLPLDDSLWLTADDAPAAAPPAEHTPAPPPPVNSLWLSADDAPAIAPGPVDAPVPDPAGEIIVWRRGPVEEPNPRAEHHADLPPIIRYRLLKKLPMAFLQRLGLADHGDALALPYLDAQGKPAATRYRHPPGADSRFTWAPGGRVLPYGLWLPLNQEARAMVLAEGESDAQSMWHLGYPCLGVPGAAAFKPAWAGFLRQRPVYLHQENDAGGETFVRHTTRSLRSGGHQGPIRVIRAADLDPACKDLSDLLVHHGSHQARHMVARLVKAAQAQAGEPAAIPTAGEPVAAGDSPLMPQTGEGSVTLTQEARTETPALPQAHGGEAATTPQPATASSAAPPAAPQSTVEAWGLYPLSSLPALQDVPRPPTIVAGMMTAGLTLLAGAPKKGKSWLALKLCLAVARGEPFLGCAVTQGDAIYLDLESRQHRVAERAERLCGRELPHQLLVGHRAPRLDDGFYAMLEGLLKERPRTRLVVVDTLGRVKGLGRGGENAYEADTRILGEAQRFALDRGLCLLMIHHLRKSVGGFKESDVFERVNGSTGLTGACDTMMVLDSRRQEDQARLYVDGRDVPSRQLALQFDGGVWSLLSHDGAAWEREQHYRDSPLPGAVKRLMAEREKWEGRPTKLLEELSALASAPIDLQPKDIITALRRLEPIMRREMGVEVRGYKLQGNRHICLSKSTADQQTSMA